MQAITVKFLGPTNARGTRYKAVTGSGHTLTIDQDYSLNPDENAKHACARLAAKLGWPKPIGFGSTQDGWACTLERFKMPKARKHS